VSKVRTGDGKRAGLGDSVSVPAYDGRAAVIVGIRKGHALLEFGAGWGEEWLPGEAVNLVRRHKGPVTADGCPVAPGMAVTTVMGGYAVHGVAGRPGWLGLVPVKFADGSTVRFRGTDLYAAGEEDLDLSWT
jgi:hypothetical protein